MEDLSRKATGSGSVVLQDIGRLKDGCFGGNVILEGSCSAEGSIAIDGILSVGEQGELHCGDEAIRAGVLIVDGKVYSRVAKCIFWLLVILIACFTFVPAGAFFRLKMV